MLNPWGGSQLVGIEGSPITVHGVATITLASQIVRTDILVTQGLSMQAILGFRKASVHNQH